jgi:AcrR family transcriptional regulator
VSAIERDRRIELREAKRVIATARKLISKHGITAVRMRDIAEACDLSMTAPLYYFGTKARMLIEILRADHNQRMDGLRRRLEPCQTREELVDATHASLRAFLDERTLRGTHDLMAEITYLALTDLEAASIRAGFRQEYLDVLARLLGDKQRAGVVQLSGHATAVASLLISLAQGLAVEIGANPAWRPGESIEHSRVLIEQLLQPPVAPAE